MASGIPVEIRYIVSAISAVPVMGWNWKTTG